MNGGMVWRPRSSAATRMHARSEKIRQKIAVAAMPVACAAQPYGRLQPGVPVSKRGLFVFAWNFVDEAFEQPDRKRR
jgi:hypothetical protein